MSAASRTFGLLAEFDEAGQLVEAARKVREMGFTKIDALSPFAVPGLDEALHMPANRVPLIFLIGGLVGAATGFLMQVYACVYSYPIDVGGRPLYSWPAFIPITFELTILFAGMAGAFGMLALNGLPRPSHPLFNLPEFDRASQDKFFLLIESVDPQFELEKVRELFQSLSPVKVMEVPV